MPEVLFYRLGASPLEAALPDLEPPAAARAAEGGKAAPPDLGLPFKEAKERLIESFERDYLTGLISRCEGNISRAAREAGIERVYLRKLLRKHGLDGNEPD